MDAAANSAKPLLLGVLAIALLTGMDALVKAVSATTPTFTIVFMRFAVTALLIGAYLAIRGTVTPRRDRLSAHLMRACLMIVTASSFFYAVGRLPLADVYALSFTAPIFIALFGALFLGEPVRWPIVVALVNGFAGMLIIVFASSATSLGRTLQFWPIVAALTAPVTYALSVVALRAQTAHEPITVIIFVQSSCISLLLAPAAVLTWTAPSNSDWAGFAAIGCLGTIGYLAFASSLKQLPAARFAVIEYTGLIWAALIGYFVFAEVPRTSMWVGSGLIIAGCLLALGAKSSPNPAPAGVTSKPS